MIFNNKVFDQSFSIIPLCVWEGAARYIYIYIYIYIYVNGYMRCTKFEFRGGDFSNSNYGRVKGSGRL